MAGQCRRPLEKPGGDPKSAELLLRRHGVVASTVADLQIAWIGIVLGVGIDLDLYAAVVRVRESRTGVVGNQVLRAQFIADLAKGGVELLQATGIEVLTAGIARELDERVLPANVAAGAVFDRHDDDAVHDDLGLLRLPQGLLVGRLAEDRTSTRLNSSHVRSSYAVFC